MKTHRILGIDFFGGTSREAVEEITRTGGLLVAPGRAVDDRSLPRRRLSARAARR